MRIGVSARTVRFLLLLNEVYCFRRFAWNDRECFFASRWNAFIDVYIQIQILPATAVYVSNQHGGFECI